MTDIEMHRLLNSILHFLFTMLLSPFWNLPSRLIAGRFLGTAIRAVPAFTSMVPEWRGKKLRHGNI
jgi:hypothetical protein